MGSSANPSLRSSSAIPSEVHLQSSGTCPRRRFTVCFKHLALPPLRAVLDMRMECRNAFLVAVASPFQSIYGFVPSLPSTHDVSEVQNQYLFKAFPSSKLTTTCGPRLRRRGGYSGCTMNAQRSPPPGGGKFLRMGSAEDSQKFGPRCVFAGGLSAEDIAVLVSIVREEEDSENIDDHGKCEVPPLVLYTPSVATLTVRDVLGDGAALSRRQIERTPSGRVSTPEMASLASPVIVVSGFTNPEVRSFIGRCRQLMSTRPAFAKAVPNALTKPVSRLFGEIAQDHADALAGNLHRTSPDA